MGRGNCETYCSEELWTKFHQVDYKDKELDASHIEPGWHAWMSYLVDKPPVEDKLLAVGVRPWETKQPVINNTGSRAAYRPYSTCVTICDHLRAVVNL